MGAKDTSTEESGTQPGAGNTSAEGSGTGREDTGGLRRSQAHGGAVRSRWRQPFSAKYDVPSAGTGGEGVTCIYIGARTWRRRISIVLMVSRQLGIEMLWRDSCHDRLCRNGFVSDLVTSKIR
jgi:hypothetical protein